MRKFWVYIHTCPNGKKYVGITTKTKPEYRWGRNGEGYYQNEHFYRAILKYGWSSITHEVFEVDSEEEMYRKEVELISFYHSNDPRYGYNHSSGGEKSSLGCKHSEESRKKQSEAIRKSHSDPEVRRKISEAHKGKPLSKEHRKRMAEALKGRTLSEEHKKHIAEAQKGKTVSEETKRHISESLKGRTLSEETRKHLSEVRKGRILSEEHKKHIAEAMKGKHHSEETRKKIAEAKKGKPKPRVKIQLPDGTVLEMTKNIIVRDYVNKGKKFEYVD